VRVAALCAALVAAALLPGEPLGISAFVVAALVGLAVLRAGALPRGAVVYGALALALAAMSVLRDAVWVVSIDLAAAWLLATVAVSGPSVAALAAPIVRLVEIPTLAPAVPVGTRAALTGTALGALVVVPFGALFWTADPAFAQTTQWVQVPSLDSLPGRTAAFVFVLAACLGLALAARRRWEARSISSPRRLALLEWAIPLALLNGLFAAFVVVQVAVLFGGHDHVLETAGLTYAEYARQGFWQLISAAALTLTVLACTLVFTRAESRRELNLRKALLGGLCILTLVVLASALRRLELYEEAFGLSRLRLAADLVALWLGGLFVLVMGAALARRLRIHLAPVLLVGSAAGLLAFSLANPDGIVAGHNIERWRQTGRLDVAYLGTLSADAAPEIATLPPTLEGAASRRLRERLGDGDSWSSFNISRRRARTLLGQGISPAADKTAGPGHALSSE
jgi:hypothetical protein